MIEIFDHVASGCRRVGMPPLRALAIVAAGPIAGAALAIAMAALPR